MTDPTPLSATAEAILRIVRNNGPTTRQQLTGHGYSESEVTAALAELFDKGAANPVDFSTGGLS